MLRSRSPLHRLDRPIVLVGLMGVGKTTVGRRLADRLRLPFHDSDEEVERAAGMRVSEIFATYGEPDFREGERKVIDRLLSGPPHILATGGGAFMNDETRALVKARAVSVWLRADIDLLVKRTAGRGKRPLLDTGDPREILGRLLKERAPVYALADLTVDSVEGPHHKTVDRLLAALRQHLKKKDPS